MELSLWLAAHKTEALIFRTQNKIMNEAMIPVVIVNRTRILPKPAIKYLSLMIDGGWTFKWHFEYAADKARRVAAALSGLLSNVKGPRQCTRRLYSTVVHSVLMYGAPVWNDALKKRKTHFIKIQRMVLIRTASAYRTVALEAVQVLSRIPPVD